MTLEEEFKRYENNNPISKKIWEESKQTIPGGVEANVKFFSPFPLFMKKGDGAYLTDVDNHRYVDYSLSYGPLILGHNNREVIGSAKEYLDEHGAILYGPPHEAELLLSKKIQEFFPSLEMLRFTSSGTEATLLAKRLSAAYTGKYKIAKFEGHYHGGYDEVLISVNPNLKKAGAATHPAPVRGSAGISEQKLNDTIVLPFNDFDSCKDILVKNAEQVGCVILEPFQGGTIPAKKEFIRQLRQLTQELEILLVFDEIKTGFRCHMNGAQGYYNVKPDLTTLGKIIGGGLPIGMLGGRREIMELLDPNRISFFDKGKDRATNILFHSGTYNGHPLATCMGIKTLEILERESCSLYERTEVLKEGIRKEYAKHGIKVITPGIGAMFHICITDENEINSYRDMKKCDFSFRRLLDYELFEQGIYNKPCTRYHTSIAHTLKVIELTLESYEKAFRKM